jgi:hypothetical protein
MSSGSGVDDALELVDEATLPDPWDADQREELRCVRVTSAVEGVLDDCELALASDELRSRIVRDVDAEPGTHPRHLPDGDRLRLALRLDRVGVLVVDGVTRGAIRGLVRDDAVDGRRALQSCGGVHDVPGRHPLAGIRTCVERHEGFPGRDPHAELETFVDGEVADRERRANRALGIVLVRRRSAEKRHNRVADELLDGAAMSFELGANALVVGAQESLDILRIHRLGA